MKQTTRPSRPLTKVFLVACALFFFACGCTSLASRTEYLAFDSTPRGLEVSEVDSSGEVTPLGRTPFVADMARSSRKHILLTDGSIAKVYDLRCSFRYGAVLLGELPWALVRVPVYGVGFLAAASVDLATGAAFDCPETSTFSLDAPAPTAPLPGSAACPQVLVFPPQHIDPKVSDELAQTWSEGARSVLPACARVVLPKDASLVFEKYAISSEDAVQPESITRKQLNEIINRTGATDFAQVHAEDASGRVVLRGRMVDAFTLAAGKPIVVSVPKKDLPVDLKPTFWGSLGRVFRLVPSAVAFTPTLPSPDVEFSAAVAKGTPKTDKSGLEYLTDVSVLDVDHPDRFDLWDVNLTVSPLLRFQSLYADVYGTLVPQNGRTQVFDTQLRVYYLAGLGQASVLFYTPLGTVGIDVGLGTSYILSRNIGIAQDNDFFWVSAAGLSLTTFYSSRYFSQVSVSSLRTFRKAQLAGQIYSLRGVTNVSLGVGVYLPETKRWLRDLF